MARKSAYRRLLKKAIARAKMNANPAAAKLNKKNKLEKIAKKMANNMTEPERIFAKIMRELKIQFEVQLVVDKKIFDFYIPSKNMIVEIDGDYFHGNPLIYESKDLNNMQIRNQRNDKFKEILAKGHGYELERVWEYDLKNSYKEQKARFKKLLKNE